MLSASCLSVNFGLGLVSPVLTSLGRGQGFGGLSLRPFFPAAAFAVTVVLMLTASNVLAAMSRSCPQPRHFGPPRIDAAYADVSGSQRMSSSTYLGSYRCGWSELRSWTTSRMLSRWTSEKS